MVFYINRNYYKLPVKYCSCKGISVLESNGLMLQSEGPAKLKELKLGVAFIGRKAMSYRAVMYREAGRSKRPVDFGDNSSFTAFWAPPLAFRHSLFLLG